MSTGKCKCACKPFIFLLCVTILLAPRLIIANGEQIGYTG